MSGIDVFNVVAYSTFFVFAVRDAMKGSWFGLNGLLVAGAGFALFRLAPDPFLGMFGLAVFFTALHYAGLVIILGPVLGAIFFIFDRPARNRW